MGRQKECELQMKKLEKQQESVKIECQRRERERQKEWKERLKGRDWRERERSLEEQRWKDWIERNSRDGKDEVGYGARIEDEAIRDEQSW